MLASLVQNKVYLAILLALASYVVQNTVASKNEGNSTGTPSVENWVAYSRYVATKQLDSLDRKVLDSCNKNQNVDFFLTTNASDLVSFTMSFL